MDSIKRFINKDANVSTNSNIPNGIQPRTISMNTFAGNSVNQPQQGGFQPVNNIPQQMPTQPVQNGGINTMGMGNTANSGVIPF